MFKNKTELEQNISFVIPELKKYWDLLVVWQKSVNLISNKTIEKGWERHILDSAQLYFFIKKDQKKLMDVGSGGGLPGIVIAILNKAFKGPLQDIVLVESDLKKSLFLKECSRQLSLNINVIRNRVENVDIVPDVLTARAFAPLDELLDKVQKNVSRETILILPKGKNVKDEIQKVPSNWQIEKIENIVNSDGYILKIRKEEV